MKEGVVVNDVDGDDDEEEEEVAAATATEVLLTDGNVRDDKGVAGEVFFKRSNTHEGMFVGIFLVESARGNRALIIFLSH